MKFETPIFKRNDTLRIFALCLIVWGIGAATPVVAAEPDPRIKKWINDLGSNTFIVRERATKQLAEVGESAMQPLAEAAKSEELEVATRASRLLLLLTESKDKSVALDALNHLAKLKNRPAEQGAALAILAHHREQFAIQELMRLGAVNKGRTVINGREVIHHLGLGEDWKGRDEGLEHLVHLKDLMLLEIHSAPISDQGIDTLAKLKKLQNLHLYGTNVTRQGFERLQAAIPLARVDYRQGALLGVGGVSHPDGAQVTIVEDGSAANRVGIQVGDVITEFNGSKFEGFEGLTAEIAKFKPGEKARLKLLRNGQSHDLNVTFGKWR